MQVRSGALTHVSLALTGAIVLAGCGGASVPSPGAPAPVSGATAVSGTERLAWSQAGDAAGLQFRAYVDDRPVTLGAAACDASVPEAACSSPLPPLADGVHSIALASVSTTSGLESAPTAPILVQKVSAKATTSAASFPDATAHPNSLRLDTIVTTTDGLAFAVDIVARGIHAPVQLAWVPDGRLFVSEADGRVRVVRPGEPDGREPALDAYDARALLKPLPIGPLGIAAHPGFQDNHLMYVSFLARERDGRTLLRIVRMREAGDTLGEAATLFEAPVTTDEVPPDGQRDASMPAEAGPGLAFGPDGLLYVALPLGVEFDREPAASRPLASMLRLSEDGRVPDVGPLDGLSAHPLGFTWHPSTGVLWAIFPGSNGEPALRAITDSRAATGGGVEQGSLRMTTGTSLSSEASISRKSETTVLEMARAFVSVPEGESPRIVRLMVPFPGESVAGVYDRVGDVVAARGGTFFVATNNASVAGAQDAGQDVIVRLRSRTR